MEIQWTNSDEYYHVQLDKEFDKKDAVRQLLLKILSLAAEKKDWNLIVLDKWIFSLGRLIGNVQNVDQVIGMDRGFRVAIQFLDYFDRLENSKKENYNLNLEIINEEIEDVIIQVVLEENFKAELISAYNLNPFSIEISEQGQRIGLFLKLDE